MFSALIHVLCRHVHTPGGDGSLPKVARTWPRPGVRLFGSMLVLIATSTAFAQRYQPFGPIDSYPDLQLFAPAEVGHFGERPAPREGVFFTYERMVWAIEGVRRSTGLSIPISRAIEHFPGGPIGPPLVSNSLADNVPDAKFTWGNRYEFGYVNDHDGWLVSYMEGFKQAQEADYGFDLVNQISSDTDTTTAEVSVITNPIPLGSVTVNFSYLPGMMDGFIDAIALTPGGGVNPQPPAGITYTVGDGYADDVDGDGIHGPDGLDTDGDGIPDTFLGIPTDFDDLVTFVPTFDKLTARNVVKMSSIELMKMYRFKPFHRGSVFELFYGARYIFFRDTFDVNASGGVLGRSNWDTRVTNNIVGPQLGGRLFNQRGRWTLQAEARFLAGYNIRNLNQNGKIGGWNVVPDELSGQSITNGLVGGANNRPLYLNPTTFRSGRQDQQFSPVGELRVSTTYSLTKSMALNLGWTGTFIGNVARASSSVRYNLPDMGILANDNQSVFSNGVTFGFVINR